MATLELVEKLRNHANVSYEDAREALDACGDDLLEALIYLEKTSKINSQSGGTYTTTSETQHAQQQAESNKEKSSGSSNLNNLIKRFAAWLKALILKGNRNSFIVYNENGELVRIPVTILVILMIFGFWIVLPLIVAGLFCGFRYKFKGREIEQINVNKVMDEAKNVVEEIKQSVKNAQNEKK